MTKEFYLDLRNAIIKEGYQHEIDWSENVQPVSDINVFIYEYIWVVLNSGMKNQIARIIYDRILQAISSNIPISQVFGHKGKVFAIEGMLTNGADRFTEYQQAENKLEYLKSLPWIGDITKYHLAKNYGMDVCKPDRHLVRIAARYLKQPDMMCKELADATGDRIATVDYVIWRAANLRMV